MNPARHDGVSPRAGGFSLVEILLSLTILALLLTSVGAAVKGSLQNYGDNTLATDLAQTSLVAMGRIGRDIRTAYDADSGTGSLTVYTDATNLNGMVYRLVEGQLQYITLTNGVQGTPSVLIGGDGEITVAAFAIVRQENALSKTLSVSVYLRLTSGAVAYETTSSAAIRKNQGY